MVRNAFYTEYMGEEYRVGRHTKEQLNLISYDSEDEQIGFVHFFSDPDMYRKSVPTDEIGEVYSIDTYCVYQGREFRLCNENDTEYLLWTSDSEIAHELGFYNISKGDYEKWVDKSEVTRIFEDKKIIPNYLNR